MTENQAFTPLLLLSHGEMDFDCPHVDHSERDDLLSIWQLQHESWTYCDLVDLQDLSGTHITPNASRPRDVSLSQMRERSDYSFSVSLVHFQLHLPAQKRETGRLAPFSLATQLICTRDLFALVQRNADDPDCPPIRPRKRDFSLGPICGSAPQDMQILPIIHRTGKYAPISAHCALELHHRLESQLRAICEYSRTSNEIVSESILLS